MDNNEDLQKQDIEEENPPMSYKLKWAIIGGVVTWLLMMCYEYIELNYHHNQRMEEINKRNDPIIDNKDK